MEYEWLMARKSKTSAFERSDGLLVDVDNDVWKDPAFNEVFAHGFREFFVTELERLH